MVARWACSVAQDLGPRKPNMPLSSPDWMHRQTTNPASDLGPSDPHRGWALNSRPRCHSMPGVILNRTTMNPGSPCRDQRGCRRSGFIPGEPRAGIGGSSTFDHRLLPGFWDQPPPPTGGCIHPHPLELLRLDRLGGVRFATPRSAEPTGRHRPAEHANRSRTLRTPGTRVDKRYGADRIGPPFCGSGHHQSKYPDSTTSG